PAPRQAGAPALRRSPSQLARARAITPIAARCRACSGGMAGHEKRIHVATVSEGIASRGSFDQEALSLEQGDRRLVVSIRFKLNPADSGPLLAQVNCSIH